MRLAVTHQSSLGLDKGSVDAVHLVVQPAGVTQVVAGTIPPPEGGWHRPAVHTLSPLSKVIKQIWDQKIGQVRNQGTGGKCFEFHLSRSKGRSINMILISLPLHYSARVHFSIPNRVIFSHSVEEINFQLGSCLTDSFYWRASCPVQPWPGDRVVQWSLYTSRRCRPQWLRPTQQQPGIPPYLTTPHQIKGRLEIQTEQSPVIFK